jgi:hypothetical protein
MIDSGPELFGGVAKEPIATRITTMPAVIRTHRRRHHGGLAGFAAEPLPAAD